MKGMVVKPFPCCGWSGTLGYVIEVNPIRGILNESVEDIIICDHCGEETVVGPEALYEVVAPVGGYIERNRVKIIPDDLLEDEIVAEKQQNVLQE